MILIFTLILFMIGSMFLLAHTIKSTKEKLDSRIKIVQGDDDGVVGDTPVVYRYLPRDIDEYYRDAAVPSKLYSGMFSGDDDALRIR